MFSRHDASAPPTAFATSRARVFALERTPRAVQTRLTSRATRFVGIARRERRSGGEVWTWDERE
jgi:hypothetical protein